MEGIAIPKSPGTKKGRKPSVSVEVIASERTL
jgi:hypothetical protein